MENKKNPYLILIPGLLLFLIILMTLTFFLQNKKRVEKKLSFPPSPTFSFPPDYSKNKKSPSLSPSLKPTPTPTPIPPTFTGADQETIPQEIVDYTQQKLTLMQKLPLKTTEFTINFDYDNDKFIVKLNPPKEENQKKFEDWLKNNYSSIPKDQFLFQ